VSRRREKVFSLPAERVEGFAYVIHVASKLFKNSLEIFLLPRQRFTLFSGFRSRL
jgi:hypothetical protein